MRALRKVVADAGQSIEKATPDALGALGGGILWTGSNCGIRPHDGGRLSCLGCGTSPDTLAAAAVASHRIAFASHFASRRRYLKTYTFRACLEIVSVLFKG